MRLFHVASALTIVGALAASANAYVSFDNMSNFLSGNPNIHLSATGSTPNTFMGMGVNLASDATDITGFDVYPVNLSGTAYNALKITVYVWDTVNTGTVNATTPAFGGLLGTYTITSTGTFPTGNFFNFGGSPDGINPGITLTTPLTLTDAQIGISFNYMGSTDGGLTYANVNSLTSAIMYGATAGDNPVTVGSSMFSGYYRNAGTPTEVNGNFTSGLRSLGGVFNQSLGVRIYSTVPTPGACAMLGLGGLVAARRRRA